MTSRAQVWLLIAIFAMMATLQIGLAGRQCVWVDEIFSLAIATGHSLEHPAAIANPAQGDFIEPDRAVPASVLQKYLVHENPSAGPARVIRALLLSDTSPPLYYLLLYGWTLVIGTGDLALRYFSILWYLAAFPLFASVARRTAGECAVLPACVLFAFSPLGLYFSGEGRMYSLLLFCIVATAWVSLALHERGRGVALYVLWVLASAAGFLTHYFFALPWAGLVIFLFFRPGKFGRWRLLTCLCFLALAVLPWYIMASASYGQWRVTQGWLTLHPSGYNRSRAIRNHILQFFSAGGSGLWEFQRWSALLSLAAFALVAGMLIWRLRWSAFAGRRLMLWLWFGIAAVTPSIVDLVHGTYFANNPRYTVSALPAAYLLAGMGIACFSKRTAPVVLAMILVSWSDAIAKIYRQNSRSGEPFRAIAQAVVSDGTSSDLILVHSIPSGVLGVARYSDSNTFIAAWVQQLGKRTVPDSIQKLVAGRSRVLFVLAHPLGEPRPEEQWLRAMSVVGRDDWTERIKIIEFRPNSDGTF